MVVGRKRYEVVSGVVNEVDIVSEPKLSSRHWRDPSSASVTTQT
jgi:hypothetical protein